VEAEEEEEADDAEQLCDCKFTLAYGSKAGGALRSTTRPKLNVPLLLLLLLLLILHAWV
jgi:hypothetical protein